MLKEFPGKNIKIDHIQDRSLIAIQGPSAASEVQQFFGENLAQINFMESRYLYMKNIGEDVLVSRCGYTGEDGFEISVSNKNAIKFVELIQQSGVVLPAGLGARNTLRLEAGLCLHGNDIDETTSPIEGVLRWTIGKRKKIEVDI